MALEEWMEEQKVLFLPSLLILSLVLLFKLNNKKKSAKEPNLPSPPKLPIIGNLHQLGTIPHRSLAALSHKYGPLMLLHFGSIPTLLVSSPDMAKEITKTHDIVFSNRPTSPITEKLNYGCTDIGFAPYGEYWRQLRKFCAIELFSSKRVRSFKFVREEEVAVMVEKISGLCRGSSTMTPVNISDLLLIFSNNVITRVVLGTKKYNNSRLSHLARELEFLLGAFSVREYFPILGWIDTLTGLDKRLNKAFLEMDTLFNQVIQDHLNAKKEDNEKDFVDLLLEAQKDSTLSVPLTLDNIKAIILDMFVAGTDTTAVIVEWAMAELVRNPSIMKKAQEEIRSVVGSKPKVEEDDILKMDYLNCIIKEILRLHPSVPLLLPRESSAGVHIKGYYIPPKTRVLINAWAIQMDPKIWDNPEQFIPERFMNNPIDFKGHDFQYLPFGVGRRICPGMSFGLASSELVLANLLYWFNWEFPGGVKDRDMAEASGLTVHIKSPVYLVPKNHFA